MSGAWCSYNHSQNTCKETTPIIILSGCFNDGIPLQLSAQYIAVCVFVFNMGVFFHFSSDMQKYSYLKLRPNQLITEGMMKKCRNINYFGELLIYLGFGLLAKHWVPILVLLLFIIVVWIPNIRKKEKSLSRYPNFNDYRKKSSFIIPFIY